jgi:hypothetical protein
MEQPTRGVVTFGPKVSPKVEDVADAPDAASKAAAARQGDVKVENGKRQASKPAPAKPAAAKS